MMNSQIIEPEDRSPAELFALLQLQQDGEGYAQTLALLEEEAFKPGNLKAFLRVLAEQPPAIRAHFYREICLKRRNSTGAMRSLEKHLKWCFNRDRKEARASLAAIAEPKALPALFRVVSLTGDSVVAREIIAQIKNYALEDQRAAVLHGIRSKDEALQSFSLHMARRMRDPTLIDPILKFYLQLDEGEGGKLRVASQRVLLETLTKVEIPRVKKWLRDGDATVRLLGVRAAQRLAEPIFTPDLVSLVLVDPKSRVPASMALLAFDEMGLIKFEPGAEEAGKVICRAKRAPLLKIIDELIRSENATLREIGLKFLQLLPEERSLETKVLKIAETDRVASVRMAALDLLVLYGSTRVLPIVMDILSDPTESVRKSSMARYAYGLLQKLVSPEEMGQVEEVIRKRKQEREEAINRFVGDFESWREQL